MFSVSINGKEKKKKRQLKVPKSPWLFYYPHPTNKKSTSKRAERTKETKGESGQERGQFPLCSMLLGSKKENTPFARKGEGRNGKTEKGK